MNETSSQHLVQSIQASEANVARMFDGIAHRYDVLNKLLSFSQDRRWRNWMIDMIPYRPGGFLVDVATGTGDVLLSALDARREYRKFLGVDISRSMLAVARGKLSSRTGRATARADVRFEERSAEALGQPDNSVDCVTVAFGFRNVINKENALQEFRRVLRADGQLFILEFFAPERGILSRLFRFYFHQVLPVVGGVISGDRTAYKYLPKSVDQFYSGIELRKALYDNGMMVAHEKRFLFGAARVFCCQKA